MKVNIPYTCTVNSKVYFAGEVELPDAEANAVEAFLGTVPVDNTQPVTDSPLPASKDEGTKKGKGKAGAESDEE